MDGVVNKGADNASPYRYRYNDKWSNPSDHFDLYYVDPELAARVSALVTDFDLRIVSTSTWRCGKTIEEFKVLLNNRFLPGDCLIGFTPDGESEGITRADEIQYFLLHCAENIERYVILDDNKGDGGDINKNPSEEKEPTDNTGDVSDTPVNPPEETPSENVPTGSENTDTPPTDDNREPVEEGKEDNPSEEVPSDTKDSTDETENNNTVESENTSEEDNTSDTSSSDDNLDNSGSTEEIPSEDVPTDNQEHVE